MVKSEQLNTDSEHLTLHLNSIPDPLAEDDCTNITTIASAVCQTEVSLVTLIGKDEQWIKYGNRAKEFNSSKEIDFCLHAINGNQDILIVEDARKDSRFKDSIFVKGEPYVVFYAGVPLRSEDGFSFGTLCVLDKEPRTLSDEQVKSLQGLARQVEVLFQLRKNKFLLEKSLKDAIIYQLKLIAAQLNPNFIYSSMNSLQSFVLEEDTEKSINFISDFSNLFRSIITNSQQLYISVEEEVNFLTGFMKLEQLRNKYHFDFEIINNIDDPSCYFLPPMILQPYVENAIIHGVSRLEQNGKVSIELSLQDELLVCIIEDNGVGRDSAVKTDKTREDNLLWQYGKGFVLSRLNLFSRLEEKEFNVKIEDKFSNNGSSSGSRVIVSFPADLEPYYF
ncbi:MAG: histidine kinase [Crocinitomicaceae bacterium]|nr:histidine kinase [Crocinitomicaceae bacterium]